MKSNRYGRRAAPGCLPAARGRAKAGGPRGPRLATVALALAVAAAVSLLADASITAQEGPAAAGIPGPAAPAPASPVGDPPHAPGNRAADPALAFLHQMLDFIGNGPAFDAKVRETVWAGGREVVGVGTYLQAGAGSGQFDLQLTMHDGDGKHRLQQISDGKLAWTRTEIAGEVSLRRVDVGRLEEWLRGIIPESELSPRLKVGAWGELLSTIARDYTLRLDTALLKLNGGQEAEPMRVLIGDLKADRRAAVLADSGRDRWPYLYPSRVHVAVQATQHAESTLATFVPARIEFWSDPVTPSTAAGDGAVRQRRLITLIEIYSLRVITPPPSERFRFENQEADVNFVNETDRYIESYGVNLTDRQRRQLYR